MRGKEYALEESILRIGAGVRVSVSAGKAVFAKIRSPESTLRENFIRIAEEDVPGDDIRAGGAITVFSVAVFGLLTQIIK